MSPLDSEDGVWGLVELEARVVYATLQCSVESGIGEAVELEPVAFIVREAGAGLSGRCAEGIEALERDARGGR